MELAAEGFDMDEGLGLGPRASTDRICVLCGRTVRPNDRRSRRSSFHLCGRCLRDVDLEMRWLDPHEGDLPLQIECVLCGAENVDRFTYGPNSSALRCGCDVCSECFRSWCAAKVDDLCAIIKCPLGSRAVSGKRACSEPVPQGAVEHALEDLPEHRRKYLMIKTDLLRDPYVKSCPGCGEVTAHSSRLGTVTCVGCQMEWCFGCHAPSHADKTCAEFQSGRSRQELAQEKWQLKHTRQCPKCKIHIQRNEGCNHIHCTLCDGHFCYACGMSLEDGDTAPYYHKLVCTKRQRHEGLKTAAIVLTLPITVPLCLLLLGGAGIYEGVAHAAGAVKKSSKKLRAKRQQRKQQKLAAAAATARSGPEAEVVELY